jgi:hypothetical protein
MRRVAALFVLAASCVPASALATPPFPANSTVPSCIALVGSAGGVPATAFGGFVVVFRDLANNPIPDAAITIDLSGRPDLHLCADQLDPDAVVDCLHKTVTKRTGIDGSAHFTILGGSNGGDGVTLLNGGKIYGEGFLLGSPTVSAFDLDGAGGVGVNDLSVWLSDFGSLQPYGRSDLDCSGSLGVNDLSLWLKAFGSNSQLASCPSTCP